MSAPPNPNPTPPQVPPVPPAGTETPPAPPPPGNPPAWHESLDADLRQEPTFGRYKTLSEFAKGFLETRAKLSQKGLILPAENAPPEAWGEVWKTLGRPDAPEGYDLTGFEAPKEGWDPGLQNEALAAFHQANMPTPMAKHVLSWYADRYQKAMEQAAAQEQQVVAGWGEALRKEWGSAFDQKFDLADRTFETYFPKDMQDSLLAARLPGGGTLADHPAFLRAMAEIGEHLAEHQLLGDKAPTQYARTPDESRQEIAKLKADKAFTEKLFNTKHPEHAEADALWLRLHQQAEGK